MEGFPQHCGASGGRAEQSSLEVGGIQLYAIEGAYHREGELGEVGRARDRCWVSELIVRLVE